MHFPNSLTILILLCIWMQCLCQKRTWNRHFYNLNKHSFWHITDIHVDQNYSRTGDVHDLCHDHIFSHQKDNGLYGNYLCDSPYALVNITIASMKRIHSSPDFIIWTGDNLPHTRGSANWPVVFKDIRNITDQLIDAFPSISIYPCIGNHDTFPPDVIKPESKSLYTGYLEEGGWGKLLPKEAIQTFKAGGYFSDQINPGLKIISLNTILWYQSNPYTQKLTDPCNQFEWLEEVLKNCFLNNIKVYIIGHVPPGYYNRLGSLPKSSPTIHPQYLRQYLNLLIKYSNIIQGQIFGHFHYDMFQLYQCDTGVFLNSALLGPSVTPWYAPNAYNLTLPVNPAIRLVDYDVDTSILSNFFEYYLNLTKANAYSLDLKMGFPEYELLYSFTETYGVPDLTTKSLEMVYEKLKLDPRYLEVFLLYMTRLKLYAPCDRNCVRAQLCSIGCTSEMEYSSCMSTP